MCETWIPPRNRSHLTLFNVGANEDNLTPAASDYTDLQPVWKSGDWYVTGAGKQTGAAVRGMNFDSQMRSRGQTESRATEIRDAARNGFGMTNKYVKCVQMWHWGFPSLLPKTVAVKSAMVTSRECGCWWLKNKHPQIEIVRNSTRLFLERAALNVLICSPNTTQSHM